MKNGRYHLLSKERQRTEKRGPRQTKQCAKKQLVEATAASHPLCAASCCTPHRSQSPSQRQQGLLRGFSLARSLGTQWHSRQPGFGQAPVASWKNGRCQTNSRSPVERASFCREAPNCSPAAILKAACQCSSDCRVGLRTSGQTPTTRLAAS